MRKVKAKASLKTRIFLLFSNGVVVDEVTSPTKSEARSIFKQRLGLKRHERLPLIMAVEKQ